MKQMIVLLLSLLSLAALAQDRRGYCVKKLGPQFKQCINDCMEDPRNKKTPNRKSCEAFCKEVHDPEFMQCLNGEG